MSEKNTLRTRLVNKHDIEANWLKATNFTPLQGELIVYDVDENYNYERIKMGDGITNVNELPFISPQVDPTLTIEGAAADAKATGDAIKEARIRAEIALLDPNIVIDPDVEIGYYPGVTEIANQAHWKDTSLPPVLYYPDAQSIGKAAFADNKNIRAIIFPKATEIGNLAFRGLTSLSVAYFPSLKTLDGNTTSWLSESGLEHLSLPALEEITYGFGASFTSETLKSVDLPKLKTLGMNCVGDFDACHSLEVVNCPVLENIEPSMFRNCWALKKLDFPKVQKIEATAFRLSALETLILRNETVCTLANANAFQDTPIANGMGYIYVPATLIEDYKAAANWSTYANQFRVLEEYTVDGTVTGELNECKVYAEDENDALEMLTEMGILDPVQDEENNILTDEDGNIFTIE